MTFSKLMLFGTLAVAYASAASTYRVTMSEPFVIGNTAVKAGDYKIEVDGDKVAFMDGKHELCTATVKVETGDEKFQKNKVQYSNEDGKYHVKAIHLAGTKTTLVFAN